VATDECRAVRNPDKVRTFLTTSTKTPFRMLSFAASLPRTLFNALHAGTCATLRSLSR
jgi:hypothetical protein